MNLELIITFIGGLATTSIPFFFSQRKQKAEAATTEIENAQKVVSMWREMVGDIKIQLEKAEKDNSILMEELRKMHETNEAVLKELHELRLDYSKLEKNYKELKKQIQG